MAWCAWGCFTATWAVTVDVKAQYHFGPDMSRNQACENAREAAKLKAISMVTGERVSVDPPTACSQKSPSLG